MSYYIDILSPPKIVEHGWIFKRVTQYKNTLVNLYKLISVVNFI